MNISSRTPEGRSGQCPVCAASICIEPSYPQGDAPCPACGCLLWFACSSTGSQLWDPRSARHDSRPFQTSSGPTLGAQPLPIALRRYQLFATCLFATASMTLLAAGLADTCWHARAVSEMIGWPGLYLLGISLACLVHSGSLDDRQPTPNARWQALGAVGSWCDLEQATKLASAGRSTKDIIHSDQSAILDHPMRDRLLDG